MARISKMLINEDNLHTIHTNKYKDITVSIKCAFQYDIKTKATYKILSSMLENICLKYPTKSLMSKAKDMLYGLNFGVLEHTFANFVVVNINYNFTNPKFFNDITYDEYINFIDETLNKPLFTEDSLIESKRNVIDEINRKLDDPSFLAFCNYKKEIAKDDSRFEALCPLSNDDINSITLNDIKLAYDNLFKTRVDVFLIGDYDNQLKDYLVKYTNSIDLHAIVYPISYGKTREVNVKKDVGQSTLIVSYKSPYTKKDEDYYAVMVGNVVFGGIPSSLLFSVVREKLSLCYSIYSRSSKYEGPLHCLTNIDSNNKDEALNEIRKQFSKIIHKEYDLSIVEVAKKMLLNSISTMDDSLEYLIDYYYFGDLTNTFEDNDISASKINNVTADDISRVFSNFEEYIVYFLEGTLHE